MYCVRATKFKVALTQYISMEKSAILLKISRTFNLPNLWDLPS